MFHFMPKSSATTCGLRRRRRAARGRLGGVRGEAALEARLPGARLAGHDLARQVAADQAGAGLRLGDEAGVVEVGRRDDPLHRPPLAREADQGAGVDPLDAQHVVLGQVGVERAAGAVVADQAAQLADDEPADPGASALGVLGVDPVVADQRVGHRHDLAVIGGVGEDLLIAGHARVEDDLAVGLTPGAERPPREDRAVLQRELGSFHDRRRGPR